MPTVRSNLHLEFNLKIIELDFKIGIIFILNAYYL